MGEQRIHSYTGMPWWQSEQISLVSEMTYNVLMGTLNPTHSHWADFTDVHTWL